MKLWLHGSGSKTDDDRAIDDGAIDVGAIDDAEPSDDTDSAEDRTEDDVEDALENEGEADAEPDADGDSEPTDDADDDDADEAESAEAEADTEVEDPNLDDPEPTSAPATDDAEQLDDDADRLDDGDVEANDTEAGTAEAGDEEVEESPDLLAEYEHELIADVAADVDPTADDEPPTDDETGEDPAVENKAAEDLAAENKAVENKAAEDHSPADLADDVDVVDADHLEDRATPATTVLAPAPAGIGGPELRQAARRATAVLAAVALVGFIVGWLRGSEEIVRRELVYTLDESAPDSFLREDRRLLTQVVTLESDAVLAPVAAQLDLSTDHLRSKLDIETVDLSEVLRLEVSDRDRSRALAISDAVIESYLEVVTAPLPAENSQALLAEREAVVAELATADTALQEANATVAGLLTREEELDREITSTENRIDRLQASLDDGLVRTITPALRTTLTAELTAEEDRLATLEADLATVRVARASGNGAGLSDAALQRDIDRLESDLTTIDEELAERELGPLLASPIRVLSEPTFDTRSARSAGLQGTAVGLLVGLPLAAYVGFQRLRRSRWIAPRPASA